MTDGQSDQLARDRAAAVDARISAHEQVCEQVRRRIDEFIRRTELSIEEIKASNERAVLDMRQIIESHADADAEAFKGIYSQFRWLVGGGYGFMIPLLGFLIGKLLHWL